MSGSMPVFEWKGRFTPSDSRSLVPLEFEVPEGVAALEIRFSYAPRGCADRTRNLAAVRATVEDYVRDTEFDCPGGIEQVFERQALDKSVDWVRNLLNLILYDNTCQAIGRWDLGTLDDPPPVVVSAGFASPGFRACPVAAGRWGVAVEVWEVFTDDVEATLTVRAIRDAASDIDTVPMQRLPGKAPRHVERARLPGVLHGEMHSHTVHSDGKYPLQVLVERAAALGLDFLAVTDHNTTSAHAEFRDGPVTLIRGEELTTFHGHFNVYGVDRCHSWHDREHGVRTVQALADARSAGALASLNHATAIGAPVCVGCRFQEGSVPYESFDLMEVWCGAWHRRYPEAVRNLELWDRLWDGGIRLVGIAARDWHGPGQEDTRDIAFPVTAVLCGERTEAAILDAVRRGRVFMTSGAGISLAFSTGSKDAGIGESLHLPPGETARLRVEFRLAREVAAVACLVRNGRLAASWPLPGGSEAVWEGEITMPGRYRVELWARDGELLLVTNHVVVGVYGGVP